jgi:trans-AT polyketide synthase, acyltransferase and oxidoreductase domains
VTLRAAPTVIPSVIQAEQLGSATFREDYSLRYAYVAGAMYKGIASAELVAAMSRAGCLAFLGTGGMRTEEVARQLARVRAMSSAGSCWGVNLLCDLESPAREEAQVDLYISEGVSVVEASAFMTVTPAIVRFRVSGLTCNAAGEIVPKRRVMAKVSRIEVARLFMQPAPPKIVAALLDSGRITREQAEWSARVPLADDVCVEADSGGHTDRGVCLVLLPAMLTLRDELVRNHRYAKRIRVGAAGGLGTPNAIAAAFMMGADFVLTGSINQCTVEAGTSEAVKDILQEVTVSDTDYAPAGDMFEVGARVQVVRRGILFPARANRLYELYRRHDSLEEIDAATRRHLAEKIFQKSFDEVWEETRAFYAERDPQVLAAAAASGKKKMALMFRWYFVHTTRLALQGDQDRRVDFQVHCGPALGAFNQWAGSGRFSTWRGRHVHEIAEALMHAAAATMQQRLRELTGAALENSSNAVAVQIARPNSVAVSLS